MNTADHHLTKCRHLAPDPRAEHWQAMGATRRAELCEYAGIDTKFANIRWSKIDAYHRGELRRAAERVVFHAIYYQAFSGFVIP